MLLKDFQRKQRDIRLASINPDKVSEVMRIKDSYVRLDDLQSFEKAITKLLADMSSQIDFIRSRSETLVQDAKDRISEVLDQVKLSVEKQVDSSHRVLPVFTPHLRTG